MSIAKPAAAGSMLGIATKVTVNGRVITDNKSDDYI